MKATRNNKLVDELFSAQNWAVIFFIAFWIVLTLYLGKSREVDEIHKLINSLPANVQQIIQRHADLRAR